MSFHLTENHRSYQLGFILQLLFTYITAKFWPENTVLVTHKGKTGPANILDILKIVFSEDKIYTLTPDKKVSQGEIFTRAEAWMEKHKKDKFPVLLEGRHRAVALWLAEEFFGVKLEANTVEVGDERAKKVAFESNMTNEQFAKMLGKEKLASIVELMKSKVYKKQGDLFGLKHGQQAIFWYRGLAVINQGVSLDDALKLKTFNAVKAVADGAQTVEEAASNGKNKPKVMPGDKIRDLGKICRNYDVPGEDEMTKLIDAIVGNDEVTAKGILINHFTGAKKA